MNERLNDRLNERSEKQTDLRFLCGLTALFLIVGLGRGSLASWDEANYAVVSKLIVQTGDWITLRWPGGGFFFDKPPLYFWLTAFFYKIFGINEFATRLPSALGGIGLVAVTYLLGRRLFGRWAGVAGAGVVMSSTDFLRYARFGTFDILQLFFFSALILAYLGRPGAHPSGSTGGAGTDAGSADPEDRFTPFWGWFWVASAGCFMTKGPLVFLAWGIVGIHFLAGRRFKTLAAPAFWWGIALFAVLVVPWHVAAFQAQPEGFWREYVVKNYVTRGAQTLDGHGGSAYFYVRVLINKYHPWIFIVPIAIGLSIHRLRTTSAKSRDILLLAWIAVVFLFFTFLVKTKLNWYILPLHPALSILVGVCLAGWFHKRLGWLKPIFAAALLLHIPFSDVLRVDHSAAIRQLAPVIHSRVPAGKTVYLYDYHDQPAALFYWDRPVAYADSLAQLDTILDREKSVWLGVPARAFEPRVQEFTGRGLHVVVRANTPKTEDNLYLLETRPKGSRAAVLKGTGSAS